MAPTAAKPRDPRLLSFFSVLRHAVDTQVPDALQHLHSFMEGTGYREMEPANAFLSDCDSRQVFCLANPGVEYVVYMVQGQSFRLNLTHVRGILSTRSYNPRSVEWLQAPDTQIVRSPEERTDDELAWRAVARSHQVRFSPPDSEGDWILYLLKA